MPALHPRLNALAEPRPGLVREPPRRQLRAAGVGEGGVDAQGTVLPGAAVGAVQRPPFLLILGTGQRVTVHAVEPERGPDHRGTPTHASPLPLRAFAAHAAGARASGPSKCTPATGRYLVSAGLT